MKYINIPVILLVITMIGVLTYVSLGAIFARLFMSSIPMVCFFGAMAPAYGVSKLMDRIWVTRKAEWLPVAIIGAAWLVAFAFLFWITEPAMHASAASACQGVAAYQDCVDSDGRSTDTGG